MFDILPTEILCYIISYISNQTLLIICLISRYFAKFSAANLRLLLHENLARTTKLDLQEYDIRRLIKLSKFNFGYNNISAGEAQSLILSNKGTVYACGYNEYGQLGLGDNDDRNVPTLIDDSMHIIQISTNGAHSLILSNKGQVYACGSNLYGQLGSEQLEFEPGNFIIHENILVLIQGLYDINYVSAGSDHSLFIDNIGHVYACGINIHGQLGLGDNDERNVPALIDDLNNMHIIQISANGAHSLILSNKGQVYACGDNYYGELGLGDNINRNIPTLITNLTHIVQISAGCFYSLVLTNIGQVYAFGYNKKGFLGLGDKISMHIPTLISNIFHINQISAGGNHSLAFNEYGVYSFGCNEHGQLGLGDNNDSYLPRLHQYHL